MLKTHKETIKTIVIAVLVSGIIAFVAGVRYEQSQQMKVEKAVKQAQASK